MKKNIGYGKKSEKEVCKEKTTSCTNGKRKKENIKLIRIQDQEKEEEEDLKTTSSHLYNNFSVEKKWTKKFKILNFNLKRIIFTFLDSNELREIYWTNKSLRLFPESAIITRNSFQRYKKISSYQLDETYRGMLEHKDGCISIWTDRNTYVFKININSKSLELISKIPNLILSDSISVYPIELENGNIITGNGDKIIKIYDRNLNLIQIIAGANTIHSLCRISKNRFAIGFDNDQINIYSLDEKTNKYGFEFNLIWNQNRNNIYVTHYLLYIPKYDYLLAIDRRKTIKIYNLSQKKRINTFVEPCHHINSPILIDDDSLAIGRSDGKILLVSISEDFKLITKIDAHIKHVYTLHIIRSEFLISSTCAGEFKLWDIKTYDCIKSYKLEHYEKYSLIPKPPKLIMTKNYQIFTVSDTNTVKNWKLSL